MISPKNHYAVVKKIGSQYRLVVMANCEFLFSSFGHITGDRFERRERQLDELEEVERFEQSISRAKRTIFEIGMCNNWNWFMTFTINKELFDRYCLNAYYKAFSHWLRNYAARTVGEKIRFLLIPEQHEDGAWHLHGLGSGIPEEVLSSFIPGIHPAKLIQKGYLNWTAYEEKFGFCSLARIKNQMAVSCYITKYITKDMARLNTKFGAHLYRASQGLQRAEILHQDLIGVESICFDYMDGKCGIKTYDSLEECMKVFEHAEVIPDKNEDCSYGAFLVNQHFANIKDPYARLFADSCEVEVEDMLSPDDIDGLFYEHSLFDSEIRKGALV